MKYPSNVTEHFRYNRYSWLNLTLVTKCSPIRESIEVFDQEIRVIIRFLNNKFWKRTQKMIVLTFLWINDDLDQNRYNCVYSLLHSTYMYTHPKNKRYTDGLSSKWVIDIRKTVFDDQNHLFQLLNQCHLKRIKLVLSSMNAGSGAVETVPIDCVLFICKWPKTTSATTSLYKKIQLILCVLNWTRRSSSAIMNAIQQRHSFQCFFT